MPQPSPPQYTVYRVRRGLLGRRKNSDGGVPAPKPSRRGLRDRGLTPGRLFKWLLLAVLGWIALSLVVFLVSAQIEESKVSASAERTLDRGGLLPFSSNTILVLGSDARPKGTDEGGANVVGQPSRADTIMLLRTGGFASAKLSIPRDTVVDIPGHGPDKINAAYAIGGPSLTVTTVERFLDIDVNHLVEVNFDNFPDFIDSLGGVYVKTGRVCAELDGGDDNGGTTLDLRPGKNKLDGRHALGLARVRTNRCNASEDDRDRAARQQEILTAIKHRLISPATFLRLPRVSWQAPKAVRTDMSGFTLLGLFAAIQTAGSPAPRVLAPSGFATTPGGGSGLTVSDDERREEVKRFLGR